MATKKKRHPPSHLSVPTPIVRKEISGKVRMLHGWKPDRPDHRDLIMQAPPIKAKIAVKADISSRMSRIEDQGDIGSCVANSSTTGFEYLFRAAGKKQPELSRLFVYYFSRYLDGTDPNDDAGTYIRTAMKTLATYGVCTEDLWPYIVSKYNVKPSKEAVSNALTHQALRYYRTPTLLHIKYSISEGFPVVFGFSVPETIFDDTTTQTGVVLYPGPATKMVGGHAVIACGYDDIKKQLKFQNSWGPVWGDKGHGYLPYDFITKGLADDFWTIRQGEL